MTFEDLYRINDAGTGPDEVADWRKLVETLTLSIIEKHNGGNINVYKGVWKRLFKDNFKKLKSKPIANATGLWNETIVNELKEKTLKSGTGTSLSQEAKKSNSSISSLNYRRELYEKDYSIFSDTHQKLNKKWKPKSGRNFEDVIHEEAKSYLYEQ